MTVGEGDRSAAVLVLIGPRWRGGPGEPDRLIEPNDWVCQEVEAALARKPGHILPVVIEQASSRMERLPESIVDLSSLQAVMLDTFRWDADVERIVGWVAEVLDAGVLTAEEGFPSPDKIKALSPPLSDKVIEQLLASEGLDGWIVRPTVVVGEAGGGGQELYKVFKFSDFRRAFSFMYSVARNADKYNHHPDWRNVWGRVFVHQRTWDARHVLTTLDFQMAAYMNNAATLCAEPNDLIWPPRAGSLSD